MTADVYDLGKDRWAVFTGEGPDAPARLAIALTPDDNKDVTDPAGANAPCYASFLFIGVAGNVAIVAAGDNSNSGAGTAVTFTNVPVGWFPVQVRRVMATNTTASGIVGCFHQ